MTKQDIQDKIQQAYQELGRFPKISEIAVALNMRQYQVSDMLKRFVQDGWLVMVGNWYRFPSEVTSIPPQELHTHLETIEAPKPEIIEPTLTEQIQEDVDIAEIVAPGIKFFIPVLRWAFLLIGTAASLLAAWYNELWFAEYLNPFAAWVTSSLFVSFSVMDLELAIYLFTAAIRGRKRLREWQWGKVCLGVLVMVLWMIVLSTSIIARVAGQYNQWVAEQIADPVDPNETARLTELAQVQDDISKDNANVKTYTTLRDAAASLVSQASKDLKTKQSWGNTLLKAQSDVTEYESRLSKTNTDLIAKSKRNLELIKAAPKQQDRKTIDDAYSWAAKALNVPRANLQFWWNLLPAIFLDVIAPVGITVFFFMHPRRRKITALQ